MLQRGDHGAERHPAQRRDPVRRLGADERGRAGDFGDVVGLFGQRGDHGGRQHVLAHLLHQARALRVRLHAVTPQFAQ
jgi:hypothetical protein